MSFYVSRPDGNVRGIPYTFLDHKTLDYNISGITQRMTIENGKVTSFQGLSEEVIKESYLIKKPAANQLAGKTFTGTYYYYPDGQPLHAYYHYTFNAEGTHVAAGTTEGVNERNDDYELIGNIAAFLLHRNGNNGELDGELAVLVNGKLEANYYNIAVQQRQYATLEEKK